MSQNKQAAPGRMTLAFEIYWSMRSPYCYLALDRILDLCAKYDVQADLRIVYPVAVRNPDFFSTAPKHYRPYHLLDSQRVADFQGEPFFGQDRFDLLVWRLGQNGLSLQSEKGSDRATRSL